MPPIEQSTYQQSPSPVAQVQSSPVSRRSSSSYTLPNDAPIPRLCRVRAYEQQLGFTIAGSKANKGVFKVIIIKIPVHNLNKKTNLID